MLVLLDRDGVINRDFPESVLRWERFEFLPRAIEAIARLTRAGFTIAICTNQSAVGRGVITQAELDAIHANMLNAIEAGGGRIAKIYAATDHPDHPTPRRKPGSGMLLEALAEFSSDPVRTPFVGDALRDLEAAANAGCPRILTRSGKGAALETAGIPAHVAPLTICNDLYAAAEHICAEYR